MRNAIHNTTTSNFDQEEAQYELNCIAYHLQEAKECIEQSQWEYNKAKEHFRRFLDEVSHVR